MQKPLCVFIMPISIHALRGEGDRGGCADNITAIISIHALRGEGDPCPFSSLTGYKYFNPRPPRGGRRHCSYNRLSIGNFNPRPPRGGRRGYGAVDGLKGANCYHDFHPFFDGISKRLYTDEELDRMNAEENTPKKYGDKEYTVYEALQRQRRMETSMRRKREKIELLEKGEANEDDILAEKAKYHALSNEYAEFSKAMGLPQQRERIRVDGRKGVDVSFGKPLENTAESSIIKEENRIRNEVIPTLKTDTVVPRQAVHRQGTKMYEQRKADLAAKGQYGPAYVTISDEEIVQLVNQYKGTGLIKIHKTKLVWNQQETIINNDKIIGFCVNNLNGVSVETSVFKIHYNKKGIHIVPDYPSKKRSVSK